MKLIHSLFAALFTIVILALLVTLFVVALPFLIVMIILIFIASLFLKNYVHLSIRRFKRRK